MANKLKQADSAVSGKAKNIIMFLGDGMSVHTVTATRNFIEGDYFENLLIRYKFFCISSFWIKDSSTEVSFDKFPFYGLSKTYCVNRMVADSACTATAYLGGVKGD